MKFPIKRGQPTLLALLITLFFLSTVILRSHAQQTQLPKPTAHLNDFAEAVEETMRQRLEKVLENLEQKTGVKFVVVTIKTSDAKDLYDYSLQLANDWNVGAPASHDKSLLPLITSENGKFFIQSSRSARAYLPDGLIGEMALHLRPKLDAGSYSDGLLVAVQTFVNRIGEQNNFNFAALDTQEASGQLAQSRP